MGKTFLLTLGDRPLSCKTPHWCRVRIYRDKMHRCDVCIWTMLSAYLYVFPEMYQSVLVVAGMLHQ